MISYCGLGYTKCQLQLTGGVHCTQVCNSMLIPIPIEYRSYQSLLKTQKLSQHAIVRCAVMCCAVAGGP